MEIPFDLSVFIHLGACILGIVSGVIILFHSFKGNSTNLPLAFGQIFLAMAIWVSFAIVSKLLVHWPYLFRTGSFFALLFVPLPFLYVSYYTQKRTAKWYDALHFIPALIFLIDFWPIYLLSNEEKLSLIIQDINDQNRFALLSESRFFPPGFHQIFRTILVCVYWFIQCWMLRGWIRSNPKLSQGARIWKNWMIVYLVFQMGLWLPFFLTFVGIDKSLTYDLVQTAGAAWLVVSSFLLLLYPSILFAEGHKSSRKKKASDVQNQDQIKLQELWITISRALDNQDLFLRPGYTINELSKDIGIPVYQISKCISQFEGMGFIDMINQKRIAYCVQKLDSGEWKNFKLEAIAHECGFNNRNSFTNAFKKFKGLTPSEYKSSFGSFISEQ